MHRLLIAVTGTPGVGKSTFAKRLSSKLEGSHLIEINDIVNRYSLYSKKDKFGTKIVNLGQLNSILSRTLRKNRKRNVVIAGHLAPELRLRYDIAVVLRCNLEKLAKRLEGRRYAREKLAENIISESLDYCGLKIAKTAKETYEVESTDDQKGVMDYIIAVSEGRRIKKPSKRQINRLNDLLALVEKGNKYGL